MKQIATTFRTNAFEDKSKFIIAVHKPIDGANRTYYNVKKRLANNNFKRLQKRNILQFNNMIP